MDSDLRTQSYDLVPGRKQQCNAELINGPTFMYIITVLNGYNLREGGEQNKCRKYKVKHRK